MTGGADRRAQPSTATYATIPYRTDTGDQAAVARYGTVAGSSEAAAIGVSASGDVFVTGRSDGAYATVAYRFG